MPTRPPSRSRPTQGAQLRLPHDGNGEKGSEGNVASSCTWVESRAASAQSPRSARSYRWRYRTEVAAEHPAAHLPHDNRGGVLSRSPRRNHRTALPPHGPRPERSSPWPLPRGRERRANRIPRPATTSHPRTPTVQRAIKNAEQVSSQSSQRQFYPSRKTFRHARRPSMPPSHPTNCTPQHPAAVQTALRSSSCSAR